MVDVQRRKDMKERFEKKLNALMSKKGQNSQMFTKKAYMEAIDKVKATKKKITNKKPEDYQRMKRYDILTIGSMEKLIVPVKKTELIKFYVHLEEVFQIIDETHLRLEHPGRDKMVAEINMRFKNITREMIRTYLDMCDVCRKEATPFKSSKSKRVLSHGSDSKCQVELVAMEPAHGYTHLLVYQDHDTNFIQLRAMRVTDAKDVAEVLLDIFTSIGAPCVLVNSESRDLAERVIKHLETMWPQLKMVHGAEEDADEMVADVKKRLHSWVEANGRPWSDGVRFVQFSKNADSHSSMAPYESLFGLKVRLGLKPLLTEDVLANIHTEEDLETFLSGGEVPVSLPTVAPDPTIVLLDPDQSYDLDIKMEDTMNHDALEELS